MFHCKRVLSDGEAVHCPWLIYSALKIEYVAITANFLVCSRTTANTSSLKELNEETHVFTGYYGDVR